MMEISVLSSILQDCGVVGAGGAGFPTYGKLSSSADTILMNCAECEPLLSLHQQLLREHAAEILKVFAEIAETLGAKAVIGIKSEYKNTIDVLNEYIESYPNMAIHELPGVYPMGDEVVLIYEATGRVVRPGGLPIECGVAVFNVETLYNAAQALYHGKPVTTKCVTVAGEVQRPITVRVPLGISVGETVAMAGRITTEDPAYLLGGPMMGSFGTAAQPVTKTTNAIIVLPQSHSLVRRKERNFRIDVARAASICCQCQSCTDLCPRHNLGHPIAPHLFMRSAANRDFHDMSPFLDTFFCSSCGLCEMYSCPQSLAPRSMIAAYKGGLRREGVKPPARAAEPVRDFRKYRKVPEERLMARLGLQQYDRPAPIDESLREAKQVKILLSQHIGAPARPAVAVGERVDKGQLIGVKADGLSVNIHASIAGEVTEVTERYVGISSGKA